MTATKLAIFGGTFDPIHRGHLSLGKAVHEKLSIDEVCYVPAFRSPHKRDMTATPGQRLSMVRLAIGDELGAWAAASDFEVSRPGPSFSWQTVQYFSETRPECDLHWIVGTDQWEVIDRWAEPEVLRQGLTFVVATRNGVSVRERDGWRYRVLEFEHPASATKIRENFSAHREWLTESVARYCEEQELYGAPRGVAGEK